MNDTWMRTAAAVALTAMTFGGEASAQAPARHIDDVAFRLARQADEVLREVNTHFRRAPQYRHLASDVREMARLARHIHEVAHRGGSLRHLRSDVRDLDRLHHHAEDLVGEMARFGGIDRRALRHITGEMRQMHGLIVHLQRDLR